MHESLTATRHSRDSKLRNNLEKTFRPVVKSGEPQQESNARECQVETQGERNGWGRNGQERMGKEWLGMNGLKTYSPSPLNIPNKRQPLLRFVCKPFKVLP